MDNLFAVPESAMTRSGHVWMIDASDKLKSIKADVAFHKNRRIYIKNSENISEARVVLQPAQSFISGETVSPSLSKDGEI